MAEIRRPYDLKQSPARSYRSKKHPNVASVMNPEIIQHYHAHVYYDPVSSRDRAARLREHVAAAFPRRDAWAMARHASRAAYAIDLSDCFPAPIVGLIFAVADAQS